MLGRIAHTSLLCLVCGCAGPAGDPGPAGAPGPAGDDAPLSLVRADPILVGPECAAGGWRIASGLDHDRDGQLDDEEVDTVTYVCDGEAEPIGEVLDGSYVIRNSADVARLDGVETITRDLLIEDIGLRTVELPTVRVIGGTLRLAAAAGVERLVLPALTEIEALTVEAPNALSALHAPVLQQAGAITIHTGARDLDLTALTSATDLRVTAPLADLRGLSGLRTVSGELALDGMAATVSLAGLEQLASVGSLDLRGIASGDARALPALATVTGTLHVEGCAGAALAFPALTDAARIEVYGNTLAAAAFEALATVGAVDVVGNPGLTAFRAPALRGSGGLVLRFQENPALSTVDLRALRTAQSIQLYVNPVSTLDLGALEDVTVTLDIAVDHAMTRLELPSLQRVGDVFYLLNDFLLAELSLPSLVSVGRFWIYGAPSLCLSQIDAVVEQMRSHGWDGELYLYNVDTSC
jgi:hypothetical protein